MSKAPLITKTSALLRYGASALFAGAVMMALPAMLISAGQALAANEGCGGDINQTALQRLQCAGSPLWGTAQPNLTDTIGRGINLLLGVIGVLLALLIIYAGFLWMTARGDKAQVQKAQDMLMQAVIGITIIVSAWVVTAFVLWALTSTIGGTGR